MGALSVRGEDFDRVDIALRGHGGAHPLRPRSRELLLRLADGGVPAAGDSGSLKALRERSIVAGTGWGLTLTGKAAAERLRAK